MGSQYELDYGGLTILASGFKIATAPGQAGTEVSGTELLYLDAVTPGTAAASKALVLNSSSGITTGLTSLTATTVTPTTIAGTPNFSGVATFGENPTFAAGKTLNLDSATATLVTQATTLTKYAAVITTEALTTAAGASQAFTITLTGVAAGDLAFTQPTGGGTNTTRNFTVTAATSTNTVTVTVVNNAPATAFNGTLIFNLWVLKA